MRVRRFALFIVLAGGLALAPGAQALPPAAVGRPAATALGPAHEAGQGAHRQHVSYLVGLADNGAVDETGF